MSTANLTVVSILSDEYSVSVSNVTMNYEETTGKILMNIISSSSHTYKYDYFLKVYDSNNNERISERFYSTSSASSQTYTISSTQLEPGTYTIKIINNGDNQVMGMSILNVVALTYNAYSVNVLNNISMYYGISSRYITMNITPSPSGYKYKYDYYLKIYDSNNNEKISKRYYSTSTTTSQTYTQEYTQ